MNRLKVPAFRVFCLFAATAALSVPAHGGGGKSADKSPRKPESQPRPTTTKPDRPARPVRSNGRGIATPSAVKATTAGDIQMGAPIQFHNISVVPVLTSRRGPFQKYTLLESGLEAKTIQVRELKGNSGAAQVNSVEVRNRGKEPVYLLGGEMILGGKQDRVIARDTVIAASGKWVEVAVFCVEAGRWRGQNMKFSAGKAMVDVSVRRAAMSGSQSEVWKEVDKKNVLHGTQSATQTYRRTIQNGEVRKKVRPYVQELKSRLPGNPMLAGLVFGVNGKIHVADIFGNPVLFGDLSEKLLSAYVLEALSHQVVPGSKPVSTDAAEQFVGRGRKARSKKVIKSGRARSYRKEADDLIGAETVDEKSGKTLRETYIGK